MKRHLKIINLILAAAVLIAVSSGIPAQGQTAPDSSAAVIPEPAPVPVNVKRSTGIMHRVLLWTGTSDSVLDRALTELIVKQAFEEDGFYYRSSASAADFAAQAASGLFNIFVLLEPDERFISLDAVRDQVFRGGGIIMIGPEGPSRLAAGSFGFRFQEWAPPRDGGSSLLFSGEPGLGLRGTIPVSGPFLLPQKQGATTAAVYGDIGKPAVLIDGVGNGRAVVMPFSVIRSARQAEVTSVYSLLLRAAVRSAVQSGAEQGRILGEVLTEISSVDHIRTQLLVTLPQGARVLDVSPDGTVEDNTILFELTAEQYPQQLRYLYELPGGVHDGATVELFYERDGKLVSGGIVE